MGLDDIDSDYGYVTCRRGGNHIAIQSVDPQTSGNRGGATIFVYGTGFQQEIPPEVFVGQYRCAVDTIDEDGLTCRLPLIENSSVRPYYPAKIPFSLPDSSEIENMMKEQLNGLDVTVTIKLHTANRLQFQVTLPEDYGDAPSLEVRTVPLSSPVITEVTKGMTPINNQIRPSIGGVPSMVTFPIAGTNTEVALAYMNLRTTFCPSRLNTPDPTRVGYFENFETPSQLYRVDYVPAFCGRYSRVNPYWFDLGTPVNLNRFPYLQFANESSDHELLVMFRPRRWQYRCINVLNVVKAKQTSAFVTFTLKRFYVQPKRDWWEVYDEYYIDHIYMGSQPHQTDEEEAHCFLCSTAIPLMFLDGQYIQRVLQTHPYMGQPAVYRQGWCSDYAYQIQFVTNGGQQPLIQVYDQSDLRGDNVQIITGRVQAGYISLCPIPGDMIAMAETTPQDSSDNSKFQVRLYVNNIPTNCNSSCGHLLAANSVPTISSSSLQLAGTVGTLNVIGTGFDASNRKLNELILQQTSDSAAALLAQTSTATQLLFYQMPINQIPAGTIPARVRVTRFGYSALSNIDFGTAGSSINTVTPNKGSLGGGTPITITGTGFTSVNQVQVSDTSVVNFVSKTDTEIKLLAPAQTAAGKRNLSVYAPNAGFSATIGYTPRSAHTGNSTNDLTAKQFVDLYTTLDTDYMGNSTCSGLSPCVSLGVPTALTAKHTYAVRRCLTPQVDGFKPSRVAASDRMIFQTQGLASCHNDIVITLNGAECVHQTQTIANANTIECTITDANAIDSSLIAGQLLEAKLTHSNLGSALLTTFPNATDRSVYFLPEISPVNVVQRGSPLGGGQLTITGSGYDSDHIDNNRVSLGSGYNCKVMSVQPGELECKLAEFAQGLVSVSQATEMSINVQVQDLTGQWISAKCASVSNCVYVFDPAQTPQVTSVEPQTVSAVQNITLKGSQLVQDSETVADLVINIGKMNCNATSGNAQTVTCRLAGNLPFGDHAVTFSHAIRGKAMQFEYFYVDRWSSSFTWGGNPPPEEDEMAVIPAQKTVLLDTDTAILTMLIIDGGTLMFDPTKDVVLSAKYVLVINGGQLKIGSETEPYPARATIMLHGHVRDRELPLYGAKVLALRNGSIEIYGMPRPVVWTRLAQTAEPGTNIIRLIQPVDWKAGEKIIITSTGGKFSHGENEEHEIAYVESNNKTVHLVGVIAYRKLSVKVNYTATLQGFFAAEVGLLTRNVLIQGTNEPTVPSDVPRCDAGFTTGHFATQTCVQGDPANQMGAEEYGGHVHIGGPELDSGVVKARLSFVELTYMGQSYRLGRYPVHFHLNGRMLNCGSTTWNNAVFRGLFAWNNNKGPECVNCGGVQFQDMLLVNNDEAGIEGKLLGNGKLYDPLKGPLYKNVHVVGYEESLNTVAQMCHTRAVVLPWSSGLTVSGLTMRNFNGPNCTAIFGTVVTCLCSLLCGGYEYRFNNITWVNTDNRAEFRWHGDYSLRDEDGSLVSGIAGVTPRPGALIVGWANHLPADKCGAAIGNLGTAYSQGDVPGVLCLPEVTALRYTIADIVPKLLAGGKLRVTLLGGGTEDVPYKTRGLTDGAGWMTTLVNNHTYVVNFEGAPAFSNFSYTGHMDNFRDGDYIIIRHEGVPKKPDMVGVILGVAPVEPFKSPLDPALIIPRDKWLVLDTSINIRLEVFRIAGAFEIISGTQQAQMDYRIAFRQLSVERGRFLAGITPETPLSYANLTLTVCGKSTDPDNLTSIGGTVIGPKAIAVYGQMFLHGQRRLPPWTVLRTTAEAGTKHLKLEEPVDMWRVGDRVVVSTTSKDYRQSEVRTIVSMSEDKTIVELDSNLQYSHVAYSESYGAYSFKVGAEVAVLTSNIVIQGDDQSEQDKFGGRILVSVAEIDGIYTVGQLRLSDNDLKFCYNIVDRTYRNLLPLFQAVLLRQMGQSRYLSSTDARLPVAFINCGDLDRRSYINYSMFENSFSHAIGIYGTDNVDIRYTVVYKSGGSGLVVEGNGVSLFHVAIIESGWSGSSTSGSNDGGLDLMIQSAINLRKATATKLYDVVVGGAERVCIVTSGLNCDADSLKQWQYVTAHSCLIGIMNVAENMDCTLVGNVIVYSTSDFSIYWHTMSSVQANSVQLADNTGGLYPYISKPDAQLNEHHNKTFTLKNSLVVGRSGRQSCTDAAPNEAVQRAKDLLGPYAPGGGNLGITPAQFMSTNGIVEKTGLQDWGSEFSLGGASYLQNVTIANFGSSCPGAVDMVWRTATINEDGFQPTYMEKITLQNVKPESKVYFDRPALRHVKFGKCGDMECDGLKKALLIDNDGTFLGAPGSTIPQSEWQWDLNPAYGIVSSQIPVRMRTNRDGSTRDINTAWPKKGIIRDESCVYSDVMQGYKCGAALQHRLLLIESMDSDQLVRRVAPIGFGTEGLQVNYLDLINGPADHGVCSSYVCMKRMSAFFAVVAQSKQFVTYFTATPPQHLRLRLFQAPADYAVRVGFDYLTTARLDVYANGKYVKPSNGAYNDKVNYRTNFRKFKLIRSVRHL
ncbi:uncharacterized protein DEA37_0005520 [Paragonimus westermani]|uniref:G8 domain-containing protein n=1 Tax=Paragonimus westermani TaxID=34504 RepID=A0A5J4NYN8_9TREM|nr:uncharacterized protein DEA37_0005520 [Paragonimus westermani]